MRTVSIGGQEYSAGLDWRLAASRDEILARAEEAGRSRGVVLRQGKAIVGAGFALEAAAAPPSAAALLALLSQGGAVCAVEWAGPGGAREYWMAAAQGGAVVAGTDGLHDDPALLRHQVEELVRDFRCRVTGSASAGFGGDGLPALAGASPRQRAAAAIKPLKAGASPAQALVLLAAFGLAGYLAWSLLEPDAPPPAAAIPRADPDEELRRQAVAERNRLLSADLSGFAPLRLARAARAAARPLERSAAGWRLAAKRCDAALCGVAWRAMGAASSPRALAGALGIPRGQIAESSLAAEEVGAQEALGVAGETVQADEATRPGGSVQTLVDLCRAYNARGGACALEQAQAAAIQNAQLLPPGLAYRRGTLALAGPLGGAEALLAPFDGPALTPWLRADRFDIDFDKSEFRLEAHYAIP